MFLWALWRKIKVDKNGSKYILFRIDVYFSEYNLATEVDEKRHTDRDLFFFFKKNLIVNLLELILVKKIAVQIMRLVEHKHVLASSKIKKWDY